MVEHRWWATLGSTGTGEAADECRAQATWVPPKNDTEFGHGDCRVLPEHASEVRPRDWDGRAGGRGARHSASSSKTMATLWKRSRRRRSARRRLPASVELRSTAEYVVEGTTPSGKC